MTGVSLGKLVRIDPRVVWREERQFSAWLAQPENIALLNEAIGLEIELIQQEVPVGNFAVDLFGKDASSGHEVVIENQLGSTDHGHLGQLLTYAAGLDAKVVVWVSPHFRDEHKQTLDWLNRDTTEGLSFFGVQLEVYRIGGSDPAPNFKVLAEPSEWKEEVVSAVRGEVSERRRAYHDFFEDLLARLKKRFPGFTTSTRVGYDNWITFGAGRAGFGIAVEFMQPNLFIVQLNVDGPQKDVNKLAFDRLHTTAQEIQEALGEPLHWKRLDDRKMCRIQVQREGNIDSSEEILEGLKEWAVEFLPRFREVIGPRIRALNLQSSSEI